MQDYRIPEFNEILNLEKKSFKEGSGIFQEKIIGKWRFKYVWKKSEQNADNISSSLLQVLSASLELSEIDSDGEDEGKDLEIINSVKFGLLSIVFKGKAFLKGKRPLLFFYFQKFFLKIGNFEIIEKSINKIDDKKMPFFSLIGVDLNKRWLCARGKGGGLAIWIKD